MTKLCKREGCNHPKGMHEYTRDAGPGSGACTVIQCPCSYELFGYMEYTREELYRKIEDPDLTCTGCLGVFTDKEFSNNDDKCPKCNKEHDVDRY